MDKAMVVMVAPNGARRNKNDHPEIPLTPKELAITANRSIEAGATAIHLHVRNPKDGSHSLDPELCSDALSEFNEQLNGQMLVQITTEAVGQYAVEAQMKLVEKLEPEAASLALREFAQADPGRLRAFCHHIREKKILPQWIIYQPDEIKTLQQWIEMQILPGSAYPVLFVIGRYLEPNEIKPKLLDDYTKLTEGIKSWMCCAFGQAEYAVMLHAATSGGHGRVGFENNLYLDNGDLASDNAALVAQVVQALPKYQRRQATYEETKALFTPEW